MTRAARWTLLFAAFALAACGGDDGDGGGADTGADVADTGVDVVEDTGSTDTGRPDTPQSDPPRIESIDPAEGPLSGEQSITIRGDEFLSPCRAVFGITDALATNVVNERTLAVTTPPGEEGGAVLVRVSCRNGDAELDDGYTYIAPTDTEITAVEPSAGPTEGGTAITIRGVAFEAGDRNAVAVGGQFATDVEVVDSETITAVTPENTPGLVSVTVDLGGDVVTAEESFLYVDPVVIDAIEPMLGDALGGTVVTFSGSGFDELAGFEVAFGEAVADPGTYEFAEDGTSLSVEAPASDTLGLVDLRLTWVLDELIVDDGFGYVEPVVIDRMVPNAVLIGSSQRITLEGTGFDAEADPLTVLVGETEAFDVSVENATSVTFITPPVEPGSYTVTLEHGLQLRDAPEPLRVASPITLDEITPTSGDPAGGARVTLTGTGFVDTMTVFFGYTPGTDLVVETAERARVTAPAGSGTADIVVRNPPANATLEDAFTWE